MSHTKNKHRVVIVGAGFGGLWAARALRRANVEVTIIDKRNFHLFQPLLYQVATGGLSPADIASPLRGIFSGQKNASVMLGEVTGVDLERRLVLMRDDQIEYDNLIVAVGSENHYFGHDQWSSVAPGLKTIEDALRIRNRIFSVFEKAERQPDELERSRLMTFVIVGGGSTGVELAGALGEITRITLRDNFKSIDPATTRILLLEGTDDILPGYDPGLRAKARSSLEKLGVTVITGALAEQIDESGVTVKENKSRRRIESRTVLWTAGVRASSLAQLLTGNNEDRLDKSGKVIVNDDLTVPDHPEVYVIGDLAFVKDKSGSPLPGNAPVAISQGRYAARSIARKLKGKSVKRYRYWNRGNMAVLGRAAAVADLGWARFSGYPAWLLWLFVHLMYLVEYDNRLIVFIQWAWNYFTRNRGARLITYCDQL